MTTDERYAALAKATPEMKRKIDAVLLGNDMMTARNGSAPNLRLMTITECCKRLGMNYQRFYRLMKDGLFDLVPSTGKTLVRESSVIEFAMGLRKPSQAALDRHAAMNEARRAKYHDAKLAKTHKPTEEQIAAAMGWEV